MSNAEWFLLVGSLMLAMGLTASTIRRSPLTTAIIYLAVGLLFGPTGLGAFHFNPLKEAQLLEALTEAAVLISLFAAGVKMPVPVTWRRWRTPVMLATVSMAVSVSLVAAFTHLVLGLPLGAAVLLGAIVAPTDPVLATEVQVRHPGDRDRLRFGLTCEAGLNDGSAFPFVMLGMGMLGLHDLGDFGARWLFVDVIWATLAGVAVGVALGSATGRLGWYLRHERPGHGLLDDFLGLGLIGVVYGVSELFSAWGFLAVFFAAVALRHTEMSLAGELKPEPQQLQTNEEAPDEVQGTDLSTVSEGSLVFKEHLERLSEILLILLVGGTLFLDSWSWKGISLALFLFLVARPLSVMTGLAGSRASWRIRGMASWFGVRGIGSLYYLMFAIVHGLPEPIALEMIHYTLIVVAMSIVMHGVSVKPAMRRFWRRETG